MKDLLQICGAFILFMTVVSGAIFAGLWIVSKILGLS